MALPPGHVLRAARNDSDDRSLLLDALSRFPISTSSFGAQSFMRVGWGECDAAEVDHALRRKAMQNRPTPPAPMLLLDAQGQLVAFAIMSVVTFGTTRYLVKKHADGTADGLRALLHALPKIAHTEECDVVGGYMPTLDWVVAMLDESEVYARQTQTEQIVFTWRNADYA